MEIKRSISPPKYTRYGRNVRKQNRLFKKYLQLCCRTFFHESCIFCLLMKNIPSAKLDTAQHWPSIVKNLPKIGCQYRAVSGMITPACTWRPILIQTLIASTCFRHSNGPMLCRTLVFSLPEWFAVVKVTHGPVMCRP